MKPEEVLQTCLQAMEEGRKSPAECAAAFPHLPDLEAQLLMASQLRAWPAPTLSPEGYRDIGARLHKQLRLLQRPPRVIRRPSSVLRWATALGLIVTLLFASVGTVAASSHSLPGDAFYPVKRTTEAVQLMLTPASERASLHVALAQKRLDEIVALTERGRLTPDLLNDLTGRLAAETEVALGEVENASSAQEAEVLGTIIQLTDRSQIVLASLQASAPPQTQAGLAHALEVSSQSHQTAQRHLEQGQSPQEDHGSGRSTSNPESLTLTPTEAVRGQTQVPAGQQKKTATATAVPSRTPRAEPRDPTQASEGSDTGAAYDTSTPPQPTPIPPGQQKKTATATAVPSRTPRATQGPAGGGGSGADCSANNPQSPNYCTPTSPPEIPPTGPPENTAPTPCPLNPAGHPVCRP